MFSSGKKLISHCLCVAVQLVEISIVWCLVLPLNRFVCLFGVDFSRFYFCVCVCCKSIFPDVRCRLMLKFQCKFCVFILTAHVTLFVWCIF